MNTNSKHYEKLNIQPWEIMEANFSTEEFIAYLKGNIIKYTLRSKGQDLSDAEKIKHYAEKLIEVQKGCPVLVAEKPEEVAEAPLVKREKTYTYKVGDRVRLVVTNETGTIIRTPVEGLREVDKENYIIELDEEYKGWDANKKEHLVDSDRAWYADDEGLEALTEGKHNFKVGDRVELVGWEYHFKKGQSKKATVIKIGVPYQREEYLLELDEKEKGWHATERAEGIKCDNAWLVREDQIKLLKPAKDKTLEPNKWYDASIYTVEELKELLPVGTKVLVTAEHDNDRNVKLEKEIVKEDKVEKVTKRPLTKDTRIGLSEDLWFRRYFKIIK